MAFTMHSHSGQFCGHAVDRLEEVVQQAIVLGFRTLGMSEHMPRVHVEDLYPEEKGEDLQASLVALDRLFEDYVCEALRLREAYADRITILVGFEAEWIHGAADDGVRVQALAARPELDYFVGSVHHVGADGVPIDYDKASYARAVKTSQQKALSVDSLSAEVKAKVVADPEAALYLDYYDQQLAMLQALRPRVVGHFDLVRLLSADPARDCRAAWGGAVWPAIERNLRAVAAAGGWLECNTSALRKGLEEPYPARPIAEAWLRMGGRFTMSDDSHGIGHVATNYRRGLAYLASLGVTEVWTLARVASGGGLVEKSVSLNEFAASLKVPEEVEKTMADSTAAEVLVPKFQYERTLNQDQAGRRTTLYGAIDGQPALLTLERAPFPTAPEYLGSVAGSLGWLKNLGANDVYFWYLAGERAPEEATETAGETGTAAASFGAATPSLKINLIWPCTAQHVKKYSRQGVRLVTETAALYRDRVRPFVQAQRDAGRLGWVFNIIEGRREAEDVIYRTPYGAQPLEGFLLLPDLNWDRRTVEALHLLAIVERRDLWSLRDLRKHHVPWLRRMRACLVDAAVGVYAGLEPDQLKLYVHYQPTYYHFHIHIVHVQLEAGATQALGKAISLNSIIEQLDHMAGGPDAGMDALTLTYTLGEASELWTTVFGPLKAESPE
ncbi:mRNA decapping hydrolase [Grosmannia clavigera kw1407]|uniref:histidinol-phosphatase n=1 Tax=Grosmannia clavigera (strain kw1407 / UAMH 11150) TaxID=655863 RepID=F0X8N0_GROCL|nr:mRNA decapping hydrolase [Grosmannia clavigera kw1407]EFX05619.1 mRNA decapping hydrolase [Grosmannia clavigera kw1407]